MKRRFFQAESISFGAPTITFWNTTLQYLVCLVKDPVILTSAQNAMAQTG